MGPINVDQILITPLPRIPLEAGDVLHAMKNSDAGFHGFGEIYFSQIQFNAVKDFKRHLRMTLNLVVPFGEIEFIFLDDFNSSRKEIVGLTRYVRLTIPPGIWFSFRGLAEPYSLLMNVADIPHDPEEIERKNSDNFKFQRGPNL